MSENIDGDGTCTVHSCDADASRTLRWPEPGGVRARFCDDHAEQKLGMTHVSEIEE